MGGRIAVDASLLRFSIDFCGVHFLQHGGDGQNTHANRPRSDQHLGPNFSIVAGEHDGLIGLGCSDAISKPAPLQRLGSCFGIGQRSFVGHAMGIGLTLVKPAVARLGGEVEVQILDRQVMFSVRLPVLLTPKSEP